MKNDNEWKLFKNKCPKCKSDDLIFYSMEPEDDQIKQDVECNSCKHTFLIWSTLKWEYGVEKNV